MERLSKKYAELVRQLKSCVFTVVWPELAGNAATAIQLLDDRLAAYENTGLEPEEIRELLNDTTGPLHRKLGEWIAAETEGRMVILPCKVGSEVWAISWCDESFDGEMCPYGCNSAQRKSVFKKECLKYCGVYSLGFRLEHLDKIGKSIFLTREDAEAALQGGASHEV